MLPAGVRPAHLHVDEASGRVEFAHGRQMRDGVQRCLRVERDQPDQDEAEPLHDAPRARVEPLPVLEIEREAEQRESDQDVRPDPALLLHRCLRLRHATHFGAAVDGHEFNPAFPHAIITQPADGASPIFAQPVAHRLVEAQRDAQVHAQRQVGELEGRLQPRRRIVDDRGRRGDGRLAHPGQGIREAVVAHGEQAGRLHHVGGGGGVPAHAAQEPDVAPRQQALDVLEHLAVAQLDHQHAARGPRGLTARNRPFSGGADPGTRTMADSCVQRPRRRPK